ncbi:putative HD superfamily hydrolase of NAD metabolism [Marininema mesophilum]|uniref:bis(5'-nucleosyl)-tetraphosphatase (symmetrical) n=1 Tax=Marininema mesophilum TaxID=1048340 RepID=A0A1H2Y2E7_9BACL|nr:bis(5'-nucleosyl)-tetraphosphatase (symmetrical) YqeK [Marininema mesophilum]SDW99221.1 putative HD superfamily hydrolase of NAD metabolism [Marininema mesophilum]
MDRVKLVQAVEEQLTRSRFEHTKRVIATALTLAKRFGADQEQAELAALLHDYCKCWPEERLREVIVTGDDFTQDLLQYNKELWHAPVGAHIVKQDLGVVDKEVLDAICYHTSGRPHMTLLDKVIFVADYMEPARRFPGVEEVRLLAETDLDRALLKSLDNTLLFLIQRGMTVYPLTLSARNFMVDQVHQSKPKEESL